MGVVRPVTEFFFLHPEGQHMGSALSPSAYLFCVFSGLLLRIALASLLNVVKRLITQTQHPLSQDCALMHNGVVSAHWRLAGHLMSQFA